MIKKYLTLTVGIFLTIPAVVFAFDIILGPLPCFPGQCGGNTPPLLNYSNEAGYEEDKKSQGVEPNKGTASSTEIMFKVIYTDDDNDTPDTINVVVGNGISTTTFPMLFDVEAIVMLTDDNFTNGEQYFATSTFPKGKYQYYFETSDGTDTVRLPETDTLTFETGFSNVVFLPGIQASRLYDSTGLIWEPDDNTEALRTALNPDGTSLNPDIYTKEREIIDEITSASVLQPNIYKTFIKNMNDLAGKDEIINEWTPISYDWRLSFDDIVNKGYVENGEIYYSYATGTPYIIQEIRRLQKTSANGKVTLVAHSMGGLIGKILIEKLEKANDSLVVNKEIDKFIMVATPQLGTPEAMSVLLHGEETSIFKRPFLNQQTKRYLGQNMQSAYNLLPSEKYFQIVDTNTQPIVTFDPNTELTQMFRNYYGNNIIDAKSIYEFLIGKEWRIKPAFDDVYNPEILNSVLLNNATSTQSILNNWTAPEGIEVTQIAGWGNIKTLRGIEYSVATTRVVCPVSVVGVLCYGDILDPRPLQTQDGDGTVVVPSALAMNGDKFYLDLNGYNDNYIINRDHGDIFEVDSIFEFIKEKVQNIFDPLSLPEYLYIEKPYTSNSIYRLTLRSPVSINIYNSDGKHTGLIYNQNTDSYYSEEQIPNSYYMEFGEGKYLGLDASDEYRIELQGKDFGTFTFEIQEILEDEVLNSVEYINVPVTPATKAKLTIRTLEIMPELSLDVDGDGVVDAVLTGDEDSDILVSVEILKNIVTGLDIHKGLKKHIQKDLRKVMKELSRGKTEKAIKYLNKIIKKLKKEIKKNLKVENGGHEEKENKEHKKEKDHRSDNSNHKDGKNNYDDNRQKISTKDAQRLIFMIEQIRKTML